MTQEILYMPWLSHTAAKQEPPQAYIIKLLTCPPQLTMGQIDVLLHLSSEWCTEGAPLPRGNPTQQGVDGARHSGRPSRVSWQTGFLNPLGPGVWRPAWGSDPVCRLLIVLGGDTSPCPENAGYWATGGWRQGCSRNQGWFRWPSTIQQPLTIYNLREFC